MADTQNDCISGEETPLSIALHAAYFTFLGLLTMFIQLMYPGSPTAFETHNVNMIISLISLCLYAFVIILRMIVKTQDITCCQLLFNHALVFSGILTPASLLSVFLPYNPFWLMCFIFALFSAILAHYLFKITKARVVISKLADLRNFANGNVINTPSVECLPNLIRCRWTCKDKVASELTRHARVSSSSESWDSLKFQELQLSNSSFFPNSAILGLIANELDKLKKQPKHEEFAVKMDANAYGRVPPVALIPNPVVHPPWWRGNPLSIALHAANFAFIGLLVVFIQLKYPDSPTAFETHNVSMITSLISLCLYTFETHNVRKDKSVDED
ncbi:hypothetical protein LguiB_027200 [Lonicera macranthoides]